MPDILSAFSDDILVQEANKTNWENYHYCLARSPSVELSIGRYLTWFMTNMPDDFMNLVVCTQLPAQGAEELIENAIAHFRSLNIGRLSWLAEEGGLAAELKRLLLSHGSSFREGLSREMAANLLSMPEAPLCPSGLKIVPVEDEKTLRQWIHIASIGFEVQEQFEQVWYDFFVDAVLDWPFRTYLALLDGEPVATSQLFLSAGVAGIYNVTCLPTARRQGIGAAIARAPMQEACQLGYQIGILQASDMGYHVYRRLGFQDYGKRVIYVWENDSALTASPSR